MEIDKSVKIEQARERLSRKQYLNTYLKDKLNILLYHGVTDKPNEGIINYQGKHINKDDFLFQMEFIKKRCSPLSIDEWVEIKKNNKILINEILPN